MVREQLPMFPRIHSEFPNNFPFNNTGKLHYFLDAQMNGVVVLWFLRKISTLFVTKKLIPIGWQACLWGLDIIQ